MASAFLTHILENKIRSALNTSKVVSSIAHPTVKGGLREGYLIEIIRSILPPHFGIGSGIIIDKWDRASPQADAIIFDRRQLPPIIDSESNGVFTMDSVHRVIEIKSTLTKESVEQTLKLAWSLHPANSEGLKIAVSGKLSLGKSHYPLTSCFAYTSKLASLPEVADSWLTNNKATKLHNTIFCIPQRGLYQRHDMKNYSLDLPGNLDDTTLIRHYLSMFFHFLEDSANSRRHCTILDWLM